MRRARFAACVICGATLAAAGATAATYRGSEFSIAALMRAAAAGRSGGPFAVQKQYELGRALEERLGGLVPAPSCRSLYAALSRVAHGSVLAAEGFDRISAAMRARGEREIAVGKSQHDRVLASCTGAFAKQPPPAAQSLLAPLQGEAFFGNVRVRVPARTSSVELRWRGQVVARQTDPRPGAWTVALPARTAAGPGALEASFRAGAGPSTTASAQGVWLLPSNADAATTSEREDNALSARLATIAAGFPGYAGIYIHEMGSGRTAVWNDVARFPAASTVKLGVLVAALDRYGPRPELHPKIYDMRTLAAWSSNLAANRLLRALGSGDIVTGGRIVEQRLRRMGATRSTYPGEYRVGTVHTAAPNQPPLVSQRTTTARDLGQILTTLQAAAAGNASAQRAAGLSQHEARVGLALLLDSQPSGDNIGLFRPWLANLPAAQKQGWISFARHTAAIVYGPSGPVVVVLTAYLDGLPLTQAQKLGQKVLAVTLA